MDSLDSFDLLDLESAATTAAGGGGPRLSIPVMVQGYDTSDMDPAKHHLIGIRMDGGGDGVTPEKFFLTADDPTASNPDPTKRRPPISSFEFAAFAKALRDDDRGAIRNLLADNRVKIFTDINGLVLADNVTKTDDGWVARWIMPLQQDEHDRKHRVLLGWASVQLRPNSLKIYDVVYGKAADAVVTTTFDELLAALRSAFNDDEFGRPGAYLRVLQKDPATGAYTVATVVGGTTPNGGRIDRRDKPGSGGVWQRMTIEEAVADFRGQPAGKKLASPNWGNNVVEVVPVITIGIGAKTIEEASGKGRFMPDVPYLIPPTTGQSGTGTPGFANSTVRLTGVFEEGNAATPKFHVAGLAKPMTGELYALRDIPTPNCTPEATPAFPVYPKSERTAAAPKVELEGLFPV